MRTAIAISILLPAVAVAQDAPQRVEPVTVPFSIDQIFGSRPVVDGTLNGKPFRLVVHANAGSYLQISHADAKTVGARDLVHKGAYGIQSPGKVSDLGRDDGFIDNIRISDWQANDIPVAVFEVPAGGSQGMLGLPWLHDNRVVIDFAKNQAILPTPGIRHQVTADEMARRGYSAHPMTRDAADGRYLVTVKINGVGAPMVVSTVATVGIDSEFAKRASVELGKASGSYGGPSGATGTVYDTARPIILQIGDWSSEPETVSVSDTYAYSKSPRPVDVRSARGGALGADFMIRYGAVIDFGTSVLYLKTEKPSVRKKSR